MALLKRFVVAERANSWHVWGGGWQLGKTPVDNGWFCRPAWSGGPWLIGQPGRCGCATLRHMPADSITPQDSWDVLVYEDTPEQVVAARAACYGEPATVPDVPGYGVLVIRLIEQARADLAEATQPWVG